MSDESAFLDVIRHDPDDDTARLVYADFLDDKAGHATERAELIRVQCELPHLPECEFVADGQEQRCDQTARPWSISCKACCLRKRQAELLVANGAAWWKPLGEIWGKKSFVVTYRNQGSRNARWEVTRGFISAVEVDYRGQAYGKIGTQIVKMFLLCPLETVTITLPSVEGTAASIIYRIKCLYRHWSMPCESAFASRLATSREALAESIPKWVEMDLTWAVRRQTIPFHQS